MSFVPTTGTKLQGAQAEKFRQLRKEFAPTLPQEKKSTVVKAANGVRDLLGGAVYGFSAPGRTIARGFDALYGIKATPEQRKAEFEQSTGVNLDTTTGNVGKFVGETATFVAPGGIASSITRGAPLLLRAGAQGGASFGQELLNTGNISSATAAGAVDAALPVAGRVLGLGGQVLKGLTGGLTGQGMDVVQAALDRPAAAFRAAGGDTIETLKNVSSQVREGVKNLSKKAGNEYAELVAKAGVKDVADSGFTEAIKKQMADLADISYKNGELVFRNTPFTDAEERQLTKVANVITEWDDLTPKGINDLARRISRFRRGAPDSENFDRVIDSTRRQIREYVGQVAPTIKEANSRFAEKMDLIDEIDNVLRTNEKFTGREGIRKTAESLGRIFSSGKEFTREAIEDLEKELGIDITGTIAGVRLGEVAPRAASSIGDTVGSLIQAPAAIAARNLVPLAGATKQQVVDRVMSAPGVPESARAAVVNAVASLFREE